MLNKYYENNLDRKEMLLNILEYILAIVVVINSNTVWNFMYISKKVTNLTIIVLYILIILSFKDIISIRKNFKKLIYVFMFLSIYNMAYALFSGVNRVNFIIDFVVILIGFLLYNLGLINKGQKYRFLLKISNIIVILAAISLIFYFLGSVVHLIYPSNQMYYTWGGDRFIPNYYNIYYETQTIHLSGREFIRNSGIFTEAPMYAFILSIGLMCELFVRKNLNKIAVGILIVTILTTLSTTGILIMMSLIFFKILIVISKSKYRKMLFRIIIPLLIIIGVVIGGYFLINKIHQGNGKTGSFSVRMDDFRVGFEAWKSHKLLGWGYNQYDYVRQYMNLVLRGTDIGGSSGLLAVLPEGGLMQLLIYIAPIFLSISYSIKKKNIGYAIVSIILFVLLTVTKIPYRYIVIYFLSIGWSILFMNWDNTKKDNKIYKERSNDE